MSAIRFLVSVALLIGTIAYADVPSIEWLTVDSAHVFVGRVREVSVINDVFGFPQSERLSVEVVETIKSPQGRSPPAALVRASGAMPAMSGLRGKTCLFLVHVETDATIVLLDETQIVYSNALEALRTPTEILANVRLYATTKREEPLTIKPPPTSLLSIGFELPSEPRFNIIVGGAFITRAGLVVPNDDRWRQSAESFGMQKTTMFAAIERDWKLTAIDRIEVVGRSDDKSLKMMLRRFENANPMPRISMDLIDPRSPLPELDGK